MAQSVPDEKFRSSWFRLLQDVPLLFIGHLPISLKFTFSENDFGECEVLFTKLPFAKTYLVTIYRNVLSHFAVES